MKIKTILLCLSLLALTSACGKKDAPNDAETDGSTGSNDPTSTNYSPYQNIRGGAASGEKNFATLINKYAQGKAEPTPWAGFWWPYTGSGIASGQFSGGGSPAGKYDAARGGSTQAQSWEIKHHGPAVPKVEAWWGHCNGWTASAALLPEPREGVTVNGINFGIADIKALVTELGMSVNADFFGERTDVDDPNSPKYWDTVPNQFFLVLTNYMGRDKKAVLIDRYTGSQVWNQPMTGYQFEYPKPSDYIGASADAPNIYKINLTSTIWWADDGVQADIQSPPFNFEDSDAAVYQSRTLKMELWLDAPVVFDGAGKITSSGNLVVTRQGEFIAGGAWKMGEGFYVDAWPDYMWVPYGYLKPTDAEQDYVNPELDIEWIKAHILVPGGADDPSVTPGSIAPAPRPSGGFPTGSPWPGGGSGGGNNPVPNPTMTTTPWTSTPSIPDFPSIPSTPTFPDLGPISIPTFIPGNGGSSSSSESSWWDSGGSAGTSGNNGGSTSFPWPFAT
jgi:hypothetical protein